MLMFTANKNSRIYEFLDSINELGKEYVFNVPQNDSILLVYVPINESVFKANASMYYQDPIINDKGISPLTIVIIAVSCLLLVSIILVFLNWIFKHIKKQKSLASDFSYEKDLFTNNSVSIMVDDKSTDSDESNEVQGRRKGKKNRTHNNA